MEAVNQLENSLPASVGDLLLAIRGYEPVVSERELEHLLQDHLVTPREADPLWHRPPRRVSTGEACVTRPEDMTPYCKAVDTGACPPPRPHCRPPVSAVCLGQLLPLLERETTNALHFVKELLNIFDTAMRHTEGPVSSLPPLGG